MRLETAVVFHNGADVGSAWGCAQGISTALRDIGLRVIDAGNPKSGAVPLGVIAQADLIIGGAPEWFVQQLRDTYGDDWQRLPAKKVAWYAESFHRDDQEFDFTPLRDMFDLHYFPAIQDAEEFGGRWLPFGADTAIFRPRGAQKTVQAGFLGSLYPKRIEYVQRVGYPLMRLQPTQVDDPQTSFEFLSDAYEAIEIFVNLPALSRLLVTKVTEVMACGTFLLTPRVDHPSGVRNMDSFESGKHLVYYDPEDPAEIGRMVEYYLAHPAERAAIAKAGYEEVLARHTQRQRLEQILHDLGDERF